VHQRGTGLESLVRRLDLLRDRYRHSRIVTLARDTWIGAPPSAIRAMGLKDAAKRLMIAAGVPVTPGYMGEDQSPSRLVAEADRIGYPVLIKAVAGGGGKGMRRVDAARDFADALVSCQREAASSFGDDRALIEKYILARGTLKCRCSVTGMATSYTCSSATALFSAGIER
jgi:3-methylcrotonyl-CoA carboxylase alpha subunit